MQKDFWAAGQDIFQCVISIRLNQTEMKIESASLEYVFVIHTSSGREPVLKQTYFISDTLKPCIASIICWSESYLIIICEHCTIETVTIIQLMRVI